MLSLDLTLAYNKCMPRKDHLLKTQIVVYFMGMDTRVPSTLVCFDLQAMHIFRHGNMCAKFDKIKHRIYKRIIQLSQRNQRISEYYDSKLIK